MNVQSDTKTMIIVRRRKNASYYYLHGFRILGNR